MSYPADTVRARLEELSSIATDFYVHEESDVLFVEFTGTYRPGASGNGDAMYMAGMVAAGLAAWSPMACVLNLQQLEYTWGDQLDRVFSAGVGLYGDGADLPLAVVTGARCRPAIDSLLDDADVPDRGWLFDDVESAAQWAREQSGG